MVYNLRELAANLHWPSTAGPFANCNLDALVLESSDVITGGQSALLSC
jgi:hypothetical protein